MRDKICLGGFIKLNYQLQESLYLKSLKFMIVGEESYVSVDKLDPRMVAIIFYADNPFYGDFRFVIYKQCTM